jgi:hypothetical protein
LFASLLAARRPEQLVDDVAYSVGLWQGVIRERTIEPLRPSFTSWPGRSANRSPADS